MTNICKNCLEYLVSGGIASCQETGYEVSPNHTCDKFYAKDQSSERQDNKSDFIDNIFKDFPDEFKNIFK